MAVQPGFRWIGAILTLILMAPLIAFAGLAVVAYTPFGEDFRRSIAASILSDDDDERVTVAGSVDITLGMVVGMRVTGVEYPVLRRTQAGRQKYIEQAEFEVPAWSMMFGDPQVEKLVLKGAQLEFNTAKKPAEDSAETEKSGDESTFAQLADYLNHPSAGDLTIEDVTILLSDVDAGWNEEIAIEKFFMHRTGDGKSFTVDAKGTVNDLALSVKGILPDLKRFDGSAPLSLSTTVPGLTVKITGYVLEKDAEPVTDLVVDARITSFSELAEVFGFGKEIKGSGAVKGALTGPIDTIELSKLEGRAALAAGHVIRLGGGIADINRGKGYDLDIGVDLAVPEGTREGSVLDFTFTGFSGELRGDVGQFYLVNSQILTNVAAASLHDIGPITVNRITKTETGELQFDGIHILAGPPEDPVLKARGRIDDVFELKGVFLDGTLNLATADVLGFPDADTGLGRIKGKFAISDANGELGLDDLSAEVTGSKLISLKADIAVGDFRQLNNSKVDVNLDIANFAAFAKSLGVAVDDVGRTAFTGTMSLNADDVTAQGAFTLGKTTLNGKIISGESDGKPLISGSISSKLLNLRDMGNIRALLAVDEKRIVSDRIKPVEGEGSGLDDLVVELDIAVDKIAGGGDKVSGIKGKLVYTTDQLKVAPLSIRFLGASANGEVVVKPNATPLAFTVNGKIKDLDLRALLKLIDADPLVSGSLNASFDVKAAGDSQTAILSSLDGSVHASLWNGGIGTNLLDLTGMSIPSWIFSQPSQGNHATIVCAVVPFKLASGNATTSALVVETKNVQIAGRGNVNLRNDTLNMAFQPRPKHENLINIVTPFTVSGKLSDPKITLQGGGMATRAVGEIVALPFNLLGQITNLSKSKKHKPCQIIKQ